MDKKSEDILCTKSIVVDTKKRDISCTKLMTDMRILRRDDGFIYFIYRIYIGLFIHFFDMYINTFHLSETILEVIKEVH